MSLQLVRSSKIAWSCLNGLINVYKPAGVKVNQVRNAILSNLCRDLNDLEVREPRDRISIAKIQNKNYQVKVIEDLSDHVLAVGPRHQIDDFKCRPAISLGIHTSGVLLLGINDGTRESYKIHKNQPIRVYHITGRIGIATETNFKDSRTIARASYHHIYPQKMNALLASLQASHQKKMFELCGVDMQSQAAFELAVQGPIRPADNSLPVIYGIQCVDFQRPFFTIEVHALNENENYLATLIHEIGIQLKSVAHCTAIRCIRCGYFTDQDSLLRHQWNLQEIITNMGKCKQIFLDHPSILHQTSARLVEQSVQN